MQRIPNDRLRTFHQRPSNVTSARSGSSASHLNENQRDRRASFAELFQIGLVDPARQRPAEPVRAAHAHDDPNAGAPESDGTETGEAPSSKAVGNVGECDAEAGENVSATADGGHADQSKQCNNSVDAGSPSPATGSDTVASTPGTINMLNELLLIGGPTRLASAELRGDAKPAPDASKGATSERSGASGSGSRVKTDSDAPPVNDAESGRSAPEPVKPSGNTDERGDNASPRGAAVTADSQNDAGSLRDQRRSDEQQSNGNAKTDQSSASLQKPGAASTGDALASLRAFASLNTKQSAEPARAVTSSSRQSAAQPIALSTASGSSIAQASTKPSAQPAQLAQPHPPASNQMLRGISSAMKSDATGGSALISLRPESLGEVNIRVDVQDGQVSATFVASTPMARDLLNRSLVELRELLHSRGLTVDRLDVSLREEPHEKITPGPARTDAEQHAQAPSGDPSQDEMGHAGGRESYPHPGGAGNNTGNDTRDDSAWRPGHPRDGRSETLESAEPVLEQVGPAAPAWHVNGLIDTLA